MKTNTTNAIIETLKNSHRPVIDLNTIMFEKGGLLTKNQLLILSNQLITCILRLSYDNQETPEAIKYLVEELEENGFNR